MILQLENWHLGYSQILKDCRVDEGSVWILCNADVDAMAAARILCYMLRSDGVSYKLRPCTSYSALEHLLKDDTDTVRAVILLNLGASRNLTKLVVGDTAKVYVMDCRRPFHLANVHAGQNVVLFWDQNQLEIPSDGDNLSGNESTTTEEDSSSESEAEEEDSDDGEEEFRDDADEMVDDFPLPKKARLEENRDYDGEDEDDIDEDDMDDRDDPATRRRTPSSPGDSSFRRKQRIPDDEGSVTTIEGSDSGSNQGQAIAPTPQELHRQRRDRLRLYYSGGSFYGVPASYVSYILSTQLRFGELGDLLWLACVGVTDAYENSRLDMFGYARLAMEMKTHCVRIYPNDMYHQVKNTVFAEYLLGNQTETRSLTSTERKNLTEISLSESGRILSEEDFRFFLLRHSSLYDSMVYSNYVSTKLQLWSSKGMLRFQELLAKMGCPLEECRQPFPFMKPTLRRTLREKFEMYAEEYGLENIEFTSFKRVTGYKSYLSASDMSYAVTALLECDTPATKPTTDESNLQDEEEREAIKAFNIAYDALNSNASPNVILSEGNAVSNLVNGGDMSGNTGIGAGLRLAMSLQRNIIATAVSLVDRKAITPLRHFRYASITCTSQESQGEMADSDSQERDMHNVFAKPLALTKLAHYLMDMHRESGKWAGDKSRPLVLMAEKPRTKTYMVVGYECPEHAGTAVKNRFGQNFELAAKTMKGTFRFDSFDSNVVEVDGNDVQRFIEQLHYMMESM